MIDRGYSINASMEIKLTIPEYSDQGLKFEWENGFEILLYTALRC